MMRAVAAGILLSLTASLWALDFASTQRPAILYDAPSSAAEKIAIVSAGYPLEKVVTTAGWVKVRDETGQLAWVEESALGTKHTVLIRVQETSVMEKPSENAAAVFRVAQGVVLDMLQTGEGGWVKVRHANGQEGYLKISDVWGL